jgi:RNA polymerase sigma-70 factor, ECF subfamily
MTLPRWCSEPPSGRPPDPLWVRGQLQAVAGGNRVEDPPDPAERLLVERVRAGDTGAFETVYRAIYTPLWRFAFRLVHSGDAANDVVQDVFLSIWAQRATLSIRTTIRAYLYGATRQRAMRYIRHQGVIDRAAAAGVLDLAPVLSPQEVVAADVHTEHEELIRTLRLAIHALPERQRLAMLLYLDDDLTPSEIASTLGVTAVAARKLLAKATERLRKALPEI